MAVVDSLAVVFYIVNMLLISTKLTLALLVMVPAVGALVVYVGRRYRRISRRIQGSMGTVTGVIEEAVGANREVKVFGGQRYESGRFGAVSEQTRRLSLKVASTNALASSFVQLIAAISLALIIYLATRPSMLHTLTPGDFTSLMLSMGGILPSLKRLTTVQANLQRGIAAADEMFSLIDTPGEHDEGRMELAGFDDEIEFRDVHMSYSETALPALRGINLHCPHGSVTALVGRSGSGKSTLASLIPRLYEPSAGSVLLDGHALGDYTLAACASRSPGSARASCCSTTASRTTSPMADSLARAKRTSSPRPKRPTRWNSSATCRRASTAASAKAACCSPAASASASRSRARC